MGYCGFRGGGFDGIPYVTLYTRCYHVMSLYDQDDPDIPYNYSHIAMTYTALATLITLGDDLFRVDKAVVISSLKHSWLDNGR